MPIYTFNGIRWDQLNKYIETPTQNIRSFNGIEVPTSGLIPYYNLTTLAYGNVVSSSVVASYPQSGGGIQSGDLLLLYCHADKSGVSSQLFLPPTGSGFTSSFVNTDVNTETALFYKISNGTEGDITIYYSGSTSFVDIAIWYIKISSVNQTDPIITGSNSTDTGIITAVTASSLVTPTNNCLVFAGVTFDGNDATTNFSSSGNGWPTSIPPGQEARVTAGGGGLHCGWITKTVPTAESSSDVVFSIVVSADQMRARQFAIRPAP